MSDAAKSAYEATVARLTAIRAHLESAPRRGRLAGKVAVVTGAGSRSGIGRAAATLFAHEGARHVYCLDFDASNFEELAQLLNKRYPDVKVCRRGMGQSGQGRARSGGHAVQQAEGRTRQREGLDWRPCATAGAALGCPRCLCSCTAVLPDAGLLRRQSVEAHSDRRDGMPVALHSAAAAKDRLCAVR
jgi:NAD(P)-dependent dehydrogenase (short-subunit alcohol dehydrogenase family)